MTANAPLRVGFIGAGWADRVQIPAFAAGGLVPQAVASGRPENARRVAERHQLPQVFDDWRDLVEADTVDIVSIVTPPALHKEMAVAALEAGKHVICEKPTACNTAEAEAMLAAAQAAPEQLAIIDHELRFNPQRRAMRRLFRQNYVGRAVWVDLTWCAPFRLNPALPWNWWSDMDAGGGILNAVGSHLLDLARWMFGRIESLSAQLKTGPSYRTDPATGHERLVTADDLAHLTLRFANGLEGDIMASALAPGRPGMTITLYGTDGALRLDEDDRLWGLRGDAFPDGEWEEIPVDDPVREQNVMPGGNAFARSSVYLAQAVARTLQAGEHWITQAASFYDGFTVQKMLDAARRSDQERSWQRL